MSVDLAPPASWHFPHAGDHFATRAYSSIMGCTSTPTACRAVPRTADQEREAPVLARDTSATIPLLTSAPLAIPASAHSLHSGDHFATRAAAATPAATTVRRSVPHTADRIKEGSTRARKRHQRHHPSPHERIPCPFGKFALLACRRALRRPCIQQQQQRLHQQPPLLVALQVALCLAQPPTRGKHWCSQETPAPTLLSSCAHRCPTDNRAHLARRRPLRHT